MVKIQSINKKRFLVLDNKGNYRGEIGLHRGLNRFYFQDERKPLSKSYKFFNHIIEAYRYAKGQVL